MERKKLIEARRKRHWTRVQVAVRIGIDANTLYRWEKGKARPRGDSVIQLCELYGKSAVELDLDTEDNNNLVLCQIEPVETLMTDNLSSSIKQDLTVHLMKLVWSWPHHDDRYEELQGQIYQITDDYSKIIEQDLDQIITRRNALRSLVLFPIEVCGLAQLGNALCHPIEDILIQCAAGIAACWYFKKGKELSLTFDALSIYIPALQAIAESSSTKERSSAASLLVQCYLLKGRLAKHVESGEHAVNYLQQAVKYSDRSGDTLLRVLSWRNLEAAYYYLGRYALALQCDEKAMAILVASKDRSIPLMVHSYVYAGLASLQAQHGKEDDARASLKLAYTSFERSSDEQLPIWVTYHRSALMLNAGLTHYHLGEQQAAIDAFAQMDAIPETSESSHVESLIDRAMAEVSKEAGRDMDTCITYLSQGIAGARALRSEQWFTDARNVYSMLRGAWPGEQRIKNLRELFVRW